MAIAGVQQRKNLATAYGSNATHMALYSTAPGASAGTEISGGSPAYARKACSWSAPSTSGSTEVITCTVTFDVPSGVTIAGAGLHTALTAGTYLDGLSITSYTTPSQGTLQVTWTYTQS